jgi:hypothetical protein
MYRHAVREREWEPAAGDTDLIEAINAHITRHVGEIETVFHEIISDIVHVDVHVVPPTPERNWYTFVTSGMSERPMTVPPESELDEYAELVLCLPPTWPVSEEAFQVNDEQHYWPIRWLKQLARLPHEYETFFCGGHTIPNGDPPEPFHATTKMCCWLILSPVWFDDEFANLKLDDGRNISFLSIIPIYEEEMQMKLNKGTDTLADKLGGLPLEELMNPSRKNVAKKRFGIF